MKLLAVDDEALVLRDLERALKRIRPSCEIQGFTSAKQALSCAEEERFDVAFLDVELDIQMVLFWQNSSRNYSRSYISSL